LFKQGDFFGGINAGLDQMLRVIDGEALPEPDRAWKPRGDRGPPLQFLLFAAIAGLSMLRNFIGRGPLALIAGLGGGGIAWWITSRIALSAGVGVGLFLLALLLDGGGGFGGNRGGRVFRDIGRGGWFRWWFWRRVRRWLRRRIWRRRIRRRFGRSRWRRLAPPVAGS
jgi:uncharacterized protein